MKVTYK